MRIFSTANARWVRVLSVGAVFALSGCFGNVELPKLEPSKSALFSQEKTSGTLVGDVTVLAGGGRVVAPTGYCIDTVGVQDKAAVAFVPIASCAALSGDANDPSPTTPALLSATLMTKPTASNTASNDPETRLSQARTYLESDAGKGAMSWSGKADDLEVLGVKTSDNIIFIDAKDNSTGLPKQLASRSYRAFFETDGLFISASVTGFVDHALKDEDAQNKLNALVASLKNANPDGKSVASGVKKLFENLRN